MDEVVVRTINNRSADFQTKQITWEYKPMPRPEQFDIEFDAPGEIYFPDQIVTGNVILKISEPLNLKGVKLRFKGECSIHFTETKKLIRRKKKQPKNKETDKLELKEKKRSDKYPKNHKVWPSQINGTCKGKDNPGYVPENEKVDWKQQNGCGVKVEESPLKNGKIHSAVNNHRPLSSKVSRVKSRPGTACSLDNGLIDGPTHHYQAMETYFDCEFYIYGHKYQRNEKEMIPAGVHYFPFAFNLPPNLPPSFSSDNGIIRYMVAAVLDRPAAANLVRKAGFSIHSLLDLNMDSHAISTASQSKAVNPCGLCWNTGPITLSIRIPRKGYVPGESINVYAEVDNISGRNTKGTKLTFSQIITFTMPNDVKTHTEERVVKEIFRGSLAPGETDFWENINIHIPPVAPNNIHLTCRLMKLMYKLEMVVKLPRPWKDLKVNIPIIIGSVPLRNVFDTFLPCLDKKDRNPKLPGIKYPDFPNYSFGQCYFDTETLEGQYERLTGDKEYMGPAYKDNTPFAPTYLVYTPGNNVSRTTSSSTDQTMISKSAKS